MAEATTGTTATEATGEDLRKYIAAALRRGDLVLAAGVGAPMVRPGRFLTKARKNDRAVFGR